jgi:hypothetical protein
MYGGLIQVTQPILVAVSPRTPPRWKFKKTVHDKYFAGLMLEDSTITKHVPSSKESRAYFSKLMTLQF